VRCLFIISFPVRRQGFFGIQFYIFYIYFYTLYIIFYYKLYYIIYFIYYIFLGFHHGKKFEKHCTKAISVQGKTEYQSCCSMKQ
jgi:hypothetical protein